MRRVSVFVRHSQWFRPRLHVRKPLRRAQQTAQLAGYGDFKVLDEIAEWDYGRAEGRTRQEVSEAGGFQWDVWRDGPRSLPESLEGDWVETLPSGEQVPVHNGPGETVEETAARTRDAIDAVMPLLNAGHDVLLVAHAHVLRILTSQWLDVDPHFARLLRLDTAHYCVLSQYKETTLSSIGIARCVALG